jgi:hypothetical protein
LPVFLCPEIACLVVWGCRNANDMDLCLHQAKA